MVFGHLKKRVNEWIYFYYFGTYKVDVWNDFNIYFFISKEEDFVVFLICIFFESIMYKYGEKSLECRRKRVNTKTEKKQR